MQLCDGSGHTGNFLATLQCERSLRVKLRSGALRARHRRLSVHPAPVVRPELKSFLNENCHQKF